MKIDVNKLTIGEAKTKLKEYEELAKALGETPKIPENTTNDFWKPGKNYFIRTVTMHLMGTLVSVGDKELIIKNASWIADNGRFSDFLKGEYSTSLEVEPFPEGVSVAVGRGSLIDCVEWKKGLLRTRK